MELTSQITKMKLKFRSFDDREEEEEELAIMCHYYASFVAIPLVLGDACMNHEPDHIKSMSLSIPSTFFKV